MKIFFIFLFLFTLNCSTNKVSKIHGFKSIESKFEKLEVNKTNKNDVKRIIGPPSSKSEFNNNIWFYIEREKTNQSIIKLGIKKINKNNILVLEFNSLGILSNKEILDLNNMNDVKFTKNTTQKKFKQDNFLYNVLSSFREKLNSPTRNKKRN
tara:strand:- start:121 stop:579 length:459 start_codon:yes stop_codon:yes gene_type:complete